jgi:hypothetical protein
MAELTHVTESPEVIVSVSDIENSEFGGLITARNKMFPTETRDEILGSWIKRAKLWVYKMTNRTEDYMTSTEGVENMAKETIILVVGKMILKKGHMSRIRMTEAEYIRMMKENAEEIERNLKNLRPQRSPINITNAEADLVDPNSDYGL